MKSLAVIGANYGDEGKGLVTAALCGAISDGVLNVRYNSSAQAAHTVLTAGKKHHVFHHFGSGTFSGATTFLSHLFYTHPMSFRIEWIELRNKMGHNPYVVASPQSGLITPYDVMLNQAVEASRGDKRHGSCGMGFGEAVQRNTLSDVPLNVSDIASGLLRRRLAAIRDHYGPVRAMELGVNLPDMWHDSAIFRNYCDDCAYCLSSVSLQDVSGWKGSVVFEGAQGLGLDQDYQHFPHVTRSKTGLSGAREVAEAIGVTPPSPIYVTRSYLTRHGAGPLENEDQSLSYEDKTNQPNEHQGSLRFAPLDMAETQSRVESDANGTPYSWAITCLDQKGVDIPDNAAVLSFGPALNHVELTEHGRQLLSDSPVAAVA